ncbi:MAG: hypothetical protein HZB26_06935 [Candidatus Hydrogenedentes bacterium]|nr:hypothetical protein [Candidatus Hydrogenedentota bacterium]
MKHGKLDRTHTVLKRLGDCQHDSFVPGTPEERLALMWPLTVEMYSLTKDFDPDAPLQRHVTHLIRNRTSSGRVPGKADAEALEALRDSKQPDMPEQSEG